MKAYSLKWFALLGLVLFLGVAVAPNVNAVEPAYLKSTVEVGFGITVTMRNEGEMTATNITYNCMVMSQRTDRYKLIELNLPDMAPDEEIILHHYVFFVGKIYYGAGPQRYFNGIEMGLYATEVFNGFAIGPFFFEMK
ncbi:MAG: hypothetical protein KKC68_04995 [Candidatus Thermoplasmatota archaeon]|nr:hypothetical protein [Candidatus Thermoplasmatota archaeon]MBU1941110.1 hypothetical protein [Candidatus Thermoplasmatota archaeon]